MSRRAHSPTKETRAEVRALAVFGVPQQDIADYLDIDAKTLRKHYRADLDKAIQSANAEVGKFLFNAASGRAMETHEASFSDCLRAAMFYGKTRMGLAEAKAGMSDADAETVVRAIEVVRATKPD